MVRVSWASCTPLYLVIVAYRQVSSLLISSPLKCMCRPKCVKILEKGLAGKSHLTSASPPPSFAASCPAGPLSRRDPPRRPSSPTGPASDPSLLASPRWPAAGPIGGKAWALLLWGPRLGQPWGKTEGWRTLNVSECLKELLYTLYSVMYDFHQPLLSKELQHQ